MGNQKDVVSEQGGKEKTESEFIWLHGTEFQTECKMGKVASKLRRNEIVVKFACRGEKIALVAQCKMETMFQGRPPHSTKYGSNQTKNK